MTVGFVAVAVPSSGMAVHSRAGSGDPLMFWIDIA